MENQNSYKLKQRIIGAIVVVSLGIIVIPLLLDGDEAGFILNRQHIPDMPKGLARDVEPLPEFPPMPQVRDVQIKPLDHTFEPAVQADAAQDKAVQEKSGQDKEVARSDEPELLEDNGQNEDSQLSGNEVEQPDSNAINKAYTLQVGSFGEKNNAYSLRDKLRSKQFRAYIESVQGEGGKLWYRVRIGPELDYAVISKTKLEVKSQFKLDGKIVQY